MSDRSALPAPFQISELIQPAPGRLRVRVPALYRSTLAKQRIETRRRDGGAILAVYANPLTARVLILFEVSVAPEQVLQMLGLAVSPASVQKQPAHQPQNGATRNGVARGAQASTVPNPAPALYPPWHARTAAETLHFYDSSVIAGLPARLVTRRLRDGLNVLPAAQRRPALQTLLDQFNNLPVLLLGASALLSVATGGLSEAVAIVAVLAANGAIGFVTERRAEATIASLADLSDPIVPVLREGAVVRIDHAEVVPGDLLVLTPGVLISADARLVQIAELQVDESALTGESMPVAKGAAALTAAVPLAERVNMVYRGTSVVSGSGLAVVCGTGSHTEIGAISALMADTAHPQTPIQQQLDQLGNQLVALSGAMCGAVFVLGLLRGYGVLPMLRASISLAVAALPEGLPAVATTTLARGVVTMRARHVLIRRLHAMETIGAIQILCLDKTGTLTMNRMSAVRVAVDAQDFDPQERAADWQTRPVAARHEADLYRLLQVGVLCNEAQWSVQASPIRQNGSATEYALLELAAQADLDVDAVRTEWPLCSTRLRAEGRNYMLTEHTQAHAQENTGPLQARTPQTLIALKGSPVEVLALCDRYQSQGRILPLDADRRAAILADNDNMAAQQLRVLGFAWRQTPQQTPADNPPALIWLGLVGLADPLRSGLPKVVDRFHQAGIRTLMLTGDQAATAAAIGNSLHLNREHPLRIVNAPDLESLSDHDLCSTVMQADIFARVSPLHKLRIVQALRSSGQVVAMTGDGINDGPALRAADIGIAMGHGGTELARSAADLVLQYDSLDALLDAIAQGRTISTNVGRALHFLISSNLSEILVVLGAVGCGAGNPLSPMQLLWINLLSDVMPAIALAAEPAEDDVMHAPPRAAGLPLIGRAQLMRYGREGSLLASGALGAYLYGMARHGSGARAGAIAFNALTLGQLLHAASCRSDRHGIFAAGKSGRNRQLDVALGASFGLQVLGNLLPGLRRLLGTGGLSPLDLLVTLAGAGLPVMINEILKRPEQIRSGPRPGPAPIAQCISPAACQTDVPRTPSLHL